MKKLVLLLAILLVVPGVVSAIPNPAAVYCIEQGYEYEIRTGPDGGQYGVCIFPDGSECSAWQYYCKCEPNGIGCWPGDFNCDFPCGELACREAGEFVSISKCCEGLTQIPRIEAYDDKCNLIGYIGWLYICSDCGNGICECWESACNCPQDCARIRNITQNTYYERIQDAIDDANDGDTIEVQPGTYTGVGNRDIDFLGKAITVRSTDPEDPCVVAVTVIDCENIAGHRGFYFHNSEGPNSVLSGFTIKGGRIENSIAEGGGICCYGSSPTIKHCTVTDNTVIRTNPDTNPLGTIIIPPPGPIIIEPSPEPNIIIPEPGIPILAYAAGGGIYIKGGLGLTICKPTIYKCRIANNKVEGGDSAGLDSLFMGSTGGGGIACGLGGSAVIIDCLISNNTVKESDGIDTKAGGSASGGGVLGSGLSHPMIINCTISNNTAIGGNSGLGAPLDGGNAYGGGISRSATVINSIINNNTASAGEGGQALGGAIYSGFLGPTVINCTISKNTSVDGGIVVAGSYSTITNCILWDNIGSPVIDANESIIFYGQDPNVSTISISYNNVEGGYPGTGNIDADPCFVNPDSNDFHLLPNSPCTNAGDPNYIPEPNETDLDGNPRVNGGRIDMGAYESIMHEARLLILPRVINRKSRQPRIMAWLRLPQGITKDQIDRDVPLILYPGGIEAVRQFVFQNRRRGAQRTSIFAFFNKAELMDAIDTNGTVQLQVLGHLLEPGQYFYGSDTIRIIARRLPRRRR